MESWSDWSTWGGIVVLLCSLEHAGVLCARHAHKKAKHEEFQRFFELMSKRNNYEDDSLSSLAVAQVLRFDPRYKVLVGKLATEMEFGGEDGDLIRDRVRLSAKHFDVRY